MKLKKFIYAILLVALLLPGCRLEETVALDITLNFPAQITLVHSESSFSQVGVAEVVKELSFVVLKERTVVEQKTVSFAQGNVSITVPLDGAFSVAVVGIDENNRVVACGYREIKELGPEEQTSVSIDMRNALWQASLSSVFGVSFYVIPDYSPDSIRWENSGIIDTVYHITNRSSGDVIYHGTGTFIDNPSSFDVSFYVEFPLFGLRTATWDFHVR